MSLIGKSVGNYRVIAKIGEGGMGAVYLGEHPMIGKRVAIKTLHPDLATKEDIVARFFTEAKAVNDIGHPNIVDIVDFGKMRDEELNADVVYFVMEFLDGEGLNSRLKREGVSPREAIHVMKQTCSALSASHKKHIVHRDLKPENIYLIHRAEDKSYVKLLDFGIAKLTGGDGSVSQHKTRTGLVIGTPAYMSPEQCEGKGNVDWRSDVYSIGVVFYEMLTGRVPFPGEGFGEVLVAHLTKTPDLPSTLRNEVPASLEAIVMHALEKDKNRRFQSMDEFMAALDDPGAHLATYGSPSGRSDSSAAGTMMMDAPSSPASTSQTGRRVPTGQGPRVPTGEGPRPTTLSGASGEVAGAEMPRPKSKAPIFAALGLLVVGGGGAGAYFTVGPGAGQGKKADDQAVAAAQQKQAPKEPETARITITSMPTGARIFRAGVTDSIGTTPFPLTVKRNEPDFDIAVKLDGYKDETRTVTTQRDHDMLVSLTKVVAPPPPPPVPAAPVAAAPAKSEGGGGKHSRSSGGGKAGGGSGGAASGGNSGGGGKKGGGGSDDVLAPSF
jgi:serine/threonine-protein kinase